MGRSLRELIRNESNQLLVFALPLLNYRPSLTGLFSVNDLFMLPMLLFGTITEDHGLKIFTNGFSCCRQVKVRY